MTVHIDRRQLLALGTFGAGALALPAAAQIASARSFTHNVASGEPGPRSVLLWTRFVPARGDSAELEFEVAASADFGTVVSRGPALAGAERDYCVKATAEGLEPGRWYFYRFRSRNNGYSPVGRTRTLPEGRLSKFNIGVFSCSNLPFGWFNAYAHAAARDDIDLTLHLGDYLYEYPRGKYPAVGEALPGRVIRPASEIVHLTDYRLRYASYRADRDLQRLHQNFPMVMMWDDHESTNDSWKDGAENHQPETEGEWEVRKRIAMHVCREWLPVSDNDWQSYEIGDLATLFRPETRLTGRTKPPGLAEALAGQRDIPGALAAFRDGPWRDPARTMLGMDQERWLADGLAQSARRGTRWQVIGQQVIMGSLSLAPQTASWVDADASAEVKQRTAVGLLASRVGLPFNFDMWDGYPAARERLLRSALDANAELIVLSGDSHNAWAFNLDVGGAAAGVEFAGHSVTSPGYEGYLPNVDPAELARVVVAHNPQLEWANTSRRGYLTLELTPERAIGEWLFFQTVRERSTVIASRHRMAVPRGSRRLTTPD